MIVTKLIGKDAALETKTCEEYHASIFSVDSLLLGDDNFSKKYIAPSSWL
jgi:hypothetical protein